ncbi:MAG TPA: hypothetical protein VFW71_01130 [Actinomycetota bacterium]|nr:hypothetical protein [Actinomycetota bacterium]
MPSNGMARRVEVDIPCDLQQIDESGRPWAFLDEARDPDRVAPGAIVITGDEENPVVARVVEVGPFGDGIRARLEILPGQPSEYATALARAHLLEV